MKQKSKAVLAFMGLLSLTKANEEWQQYFTCDDSNTDVSYTLATDFKDLLSSPQDLGLVEPTECLNYCKEQKASASESQLLSGDEVLCCNHSRYYYTSSGLWAADCSLVVTTELKTLDDVWDADTGEYITYTALLLKADGDNSLVNSNYDSATGALGQPADWKLSKTWRDGYYCDTETTDYEYMSEPDTYWTGLQSREACLEFCYRNMEEYKATCCGQAWVYQYATDVTQAYCGLYISEGFRMMSVEETSTYVLFYSGIELQAQVLKQIDNITTSIEDYLYDLASGFGTEQLDQITGETLDLDTIEFGDLTIDLGNNGRSLALSAGLAISSILAVMMH